jgi:hypothetical protein
LGLRPTSTTRPISRSTSSETPMSPRALSSSSPMELTPAARRRFRTSSPRPMTRASGCSRLGSARRSSIPARSRTWRSAAPLRTLPPRRTWRRSSSGSEPDLHPSTCSPIARRPSPVKGSRSRFRWMGSPASPAITTTSPLRRRPLQPMPDPLARPRSSRRASGDRRRYLTRCRAARRGVILPPATQAAEPS